MSIRASEMLKIWSEFEDSGRLDENRAHFTPLLKLKTWLAVDYSPHPEERSFLERAQSRHEGEVETTVAVPSDRESERVFGARLARHGLQAVWVEVVNGGTEPLWLNRIRVDPNYYTPLEAAHIAHFAMSTRLVAFGVLGWLFLPLLPPCAT
jgi:hypothetical protein